MSLAPSASASASSPYTHARTVLYGIRSDTPPIKSPSFPPNLTHSALTHHETRPQTQVPDPMARNLPVANNCSGMRMLYPSPPCRANPVIPSSPILSASSLHPGQKGNHERTNAEHSSHRALVQCRARQGSIQPYRIISYGMISYRLHPS